VRELKGRLESWVAKRLAETGREVDPCVTQSRCGTRIGSPVEGEVPGPGSTPLHLRAAKVATNIPAPDRLKGEALDEKPVSENEAATNVAVDESGAPLHGYVEPDSDA
jgi:hypothetical protein